MSEFDAVRARLEARFPGKVDDTIRLDADGQFRRENYIVLTGGRAELFGDRQGNRQVADDNAVWDFRLRAVGITADICRDVLQDASAVLVNWTPTVSGRRCTTMRFMEGTSPQPDHAVKPPLFYADAEYELRSFFSNAS